MQLYRPRLSPRDRCAAYDHVLRQASFAERRPPHMKLCSRSTSSTAKWPLTAVILCCPSRAICCARGSSSLLVISTESRKLFAGFRRTAHTSRSATPCQAKNSMEDESCTHSSRSEKISLFPARAFEGACRRGKIQRLRKLKTRSLMLSVL